jgi:DNA-binding response OmpR family regulator
MEGHRLLVIEDEADIVSLVAEVARTAGFDVRAVGSLADIADTIATFQPAVIFVDLNIAGGRDSDVLVRLAESATGAHIVIMSGSRYRRAAEVVADHIGLKAAGYLDKPFSIHQLRDLLATLKSAGSAGLDSVTGA